MNTIARRKFIQATAAGLGAVSAPELLQAAMQSSAEIRIASFRFDVTPPIGHSCCGGWIKPVEAVDDPLEAIGYVLIGSGKPIVVCVVDWTGLLNSAHVAWRTALAEAAGTTPDRVAVQCVHQHNAPFACLDAQRIVAAEGDLPSIVDVAFFESCLEKAREAVTKALMKTSKVTHVGYGQAKVEQVASNRRVNVDQNGKIVSMRGSACADPKLRELPEGLIDPFLKTVAFFDGDRKLVSCHYYAVHPMSYYGDGRASSDFAGLARKRRQQDEPEVTHLYFTGCSGNIAAGKYNDGTKPMRAVLTDRVYSGIVGSEAQLVKEEISTVDWRAVPILPVPRSSPTVEQLKAVIQDKSNPVVGRNRPAYELAWHQRSAQQTPIILSSLSINRVAMFHLPAESFIEYQLRAQEMHADRFVATAAYGDGGTWYVPTKEAYPQGGYEVSVAFSEPEIDDELSAAMKQL